MKVLLNSGISLFFRLNFNKNAKIQMKHMCIGSIAQEHFSLFQNKKQAVAGLLRFLSYSFPFKAWMA